MTLCKSGLGIVLHSNHQEKLLQYLINPYNKIDSGLGRTLEELKVLDSNRLEGLKEWLLNRPLTFSFEIKGVIYSCAHAYFPAPDLLKQNPNIYKSLCINGVLNDKGKRIYWWEYPELIDTKRVVLCGHYHLVITKPNVIIIDSNCGTYHKGILVGYITGKNKCISVLGFGWIKRNHTKKFNSISLSNQLRGNMFTTKDYGNGIRLSSSNVHNLGVNLNVLGAGLKADAIAYILARVSREKTSLSTLLSLITGQDESINQSSINEIIEKYGHSSVRALGHVIVGIEGISIYHSMQAFNLSPLQDGQERSTRYVDINNTNQSGDMFFIPTELDSYPKLKEKYLSVMQNWMNEFSRTLKLYKFNIHEHYGKHLTKKVLNGRALDCARYFLPLGLRTTLILNQNGREWVYLISLLSSSLLEGDKLLGDALQDLLINTEGGKLIKHVNKDVNKLNREALDYIKSLKCISTQWPNNSSSYISEMIVSKEGLPLEWAYYVINNPYTNTLKCEDEGTLVNKLMEISNHHNGLDRRATRITSGLVLRGITDIGSIKDLNRHRGMMYIPLVMEGYQLGDGMDYYSIPPYIEEGRLQHLNQDYEDAYIKGMELVDDWFVEAEVKLGKSLAKEITKYLLPHGFNTPYFLSGDINRWHYLLNLRKGLDGHISYREWTYKCNELWKTKGITFVPDMIKPDPSSVEEFEYRS